jgi:pimeloyl-ACP methyl ester carboxylesterase
LSSVFQVVVFDNRGVGRTKDDAKELSAELLAEDVRGLIKALHLKKPHIIGQSMGGCIAQKLAFTHPDEIGKLVLLVTSSKWRQAMLQGFRSQLSLRQNGVNDNLVFDSVIPWVFGEQFLKDPKNIALLKKLTFENPYPQSTEDYARQLRVLETFDSRSDLKKIKASTLVVYGKEDIISLPFESEFLESHIPHAKMEALDCGHAMIPEVPEALSKLILTFLK